MEFTIKIEPSEGTSDLVDLLSDTEVSPEVPALKSPERPARVRTPPDMHCSICLEEYNNKCHPDICWHKFCFECLKRWSLIESSCPLCKKDFKQIYHSLVDEIFTAVHNVIPTRPQSMFSVNMFLDDLRRNHRDNNYNVGVYSHLNIGRGSRIQSNVQNLNVAPNPYLVDVQGIRRRVYSDNMWAEPLPDLSGRFRDCSSSFYRENPVQTYRLHGFIIRDITVIRSLIATDLRRRPPSSVNDEALTTYIMRSVLLCEIRDMRLISILSPYIGQHADHFLHELYNFANSPYDLVGYDRNVRYSTGRNHRRYIIPFSGYSGLNNADLVELPIPNQRDLYFINNSIDPIVVNSDDDEDDNNHIIVMPSSHTHVPTEVIEINSSEDTEESDIEIIDIIDTEPSDTFSRDQPSTSTGIRDSLNRPNTRYNLRRRRLFQSNQQPNCPSFPQRNTVERIVIDSSSDDEIIETNTRSTQITRRSEVTVNKRKRKIKKSKLKRRKKNVVESRPDIRLGIRTRSGSDSSSSSDTDINLSSNLMNIRNVY
ncbi:Hypothetical protein CINCED_3A005711 [Cinara cedri]|uniref:RING-type E3 ubiquitin transferase n=1 Tax=Cinara cedri TaxID=506608 RepID=A0A5E4NHG0_9HEMI|nr:Hypothetical protein CINCED_3A005711 [Cinara cedri]